MKNKSLLTIFLIVFIDLLGFGVILPLLPFIGEKYGATPLQIGLLTAVYSFFQLISAPVLGRLSDRFGRKKLLVISQIGTAIGFLLLAFANSLPLIFLSRIIDGITGGNISIAQAYIADVTDTKNRAKGMGLIGAAFGIGFIFGPVIGGLLSRFGFGAPALFAAGISALTVITTSLFLKESVDTNRAAADKRTSFSIAEFKKVMGMYPVGLMITAFFLLNLAFSGMQGIFPIWAENEFGYGPDQIGFIFAYIGVLIVLVQLRILPFLLKKSKERPLLVWAMLSLAFGLFTQPLFHNPYVLYLSMMFVALGNGLSNPLIQSLSSESVPKEDYGGVLGFLASAGSLGRIIGPIMGGQFYQSLGHDAPFFLGAAIMFGLWGYLKLKLK